MENSFIFKVADYINQNYKLSKNTLSVVFPNKRAALFLRKELERRYTEGNIWLPKIYSIQEAVSEWSHMNIADSTTLMFELLEIEQQKHNNKNICFSDFAGQAMQMVKDFDELDQYDINAQELFSNLSEAKSIEAWQVDELSSHIKNYISFFNSLNDYYTALKQRLNTNKIAYYGMITQNLSHQNQNELANNILEDKVIFAGFNALTNTERNIISKLIESGKAEVLWDYDHYYVDNENYEAGFFARQFQKNITKSKMLFIDNELLNTKKDIEVISVAGNVSQAKALEVYLSKSTNKEGSQAIVLSDENLLLPMLNSLPDSCDNIYVTMGFPFSKTPVYLFINQLFKFHATRRNTSSIYFVSLLKIFEQEIIKLCFSASDIKLLNKAKADIAQNKIYNVNLEMFEPLQGTQIYRLITLLFDPWVSVQQSIDNLMQILSLMLEMFIEANKDFLANQVETARDIVLKLKDLATKHDDLDITGLEAIFAQVSLDKNLSMVSENTDGLQVMGLLETRNLDFDNLYILSVNEGILPKDKSQNSLIPYDIRRHFGLPTFSEKQAVYAYHFYRLLQRAKKVFLFYNTLATDDLGKGEQSRFLLQLEHELTKNNPKIQFKRSTFVSNDHSDTSTPCIEIAKTNDILQKLKAKMQRGLAPTSISTYIRCSLLFYFKYIANIQNINYNVTIQKNETGTIVHRALELFYSKFEQKIIRKADFDTAINIFKKSCLDEALKETFTKEPPQSGFNYLNDVIIRTLYNNFLDYELNHFNDNTLQILNLENKGAYSCDFNINNTTVKFSGTIDRLDKWNGLTRVIDYKSGYIDDKDCIVPYDAEDLKEKIPEKALQLMLYKYLYINDSKQASEEVEAGIFALTKMSSGLRTLDYSKNEALQDNFMKTCHKWLTNIFEEMLDPEQGFKQAQTNESCGFCDFKTICKRQKTK